MRKDELLDRCVVEANGCISWRGAHDSKGYAHHVREGKTRRVFRDMYEMFREAIPDETDLLHHRCESRWCVNPWHLEPMTKREHHTHGHRRVRKERCERGHRRAPDGQGHWRCPTCERERKATPQYKAWKAEYDRTRNA